MVSSAIATRLPGDGKHRGYPASTGQPGVVAVTESCRDQSDQKRKRRRRDTGRMQPDPILAKLYEQRSGRDGEHECDQQHRDAVGDDRCKHDQRDQHEQTEVLGVPAAGQHEATSTDQGRYHQPDGGRHPAVDGGDRDDVHVRGGDAGRGQCDGTDPAAGAAVQPSRYGHERPGEERACANADFGTQDAGLGGEHEQQHNADERDRDARDSENLADPVRVAWRLGGPRRGWRLGEWGRRSSRWRSRPLRWRRRVHRGGRRIRRRDEHRRRRRR
jgi:hypothetical protein